ncbi:flavodoxin-dependent (E)-4-hydroxy-3-methylbut-2-enyl-diphosphate synthase [Thermanaerosceptrum fracticalcis]|uniref:4-hydroxy-3-methylbut-2-en-1-yl diphosphate synthase (flavodoxin) n=1 Tax=Thermanaerosceptrum fracticalcis TaxID=1712410 RepID=A0A7G6E0X8_THEFR|nr:flavodoxin-dependent (E)-4-hydroxy-3-methylbut-2-enyl-diphosphate synthase [Thermanaerosceptrum fracticalcis]QNB45732.1 flavodoxin-dependent (E)-4-hydroxy-3-methylbut-2-enyl-diphosphate synthase [Thermanaerosceptrum fracticalcis]
MEETKTELIKRRKTKNFKIGPVGIGHEFPVSIQSMTNTDTRDIDATLKQIRKLAEEGCEIIRVAVPDQEAAEALSSIVGSSPLPVVADIHFDYKLALTAIKNGVQGLRINPGNIGAQWKVREVVKAALDKKTPIRIGVNSGSLEKSILDKYGGVTPEAMVESALKHVDILEKQGFSLIKVSLKASLVPLMIEAYRLFAQKTDYPLHLGVTEAGLVNQGTIKSAVGIGTLLAEGIGDTIRVSLTGDPLPEIKVAREILKTLGLRKQGVEIISCPTCGRCRIDLAKIAAQVEERTRDLPMPLKIAVMGCAVNGPGEAREADLGIAGGDGEGIIFVKGVVKRKVPEDMLVQALWEEIAEISEKGEKEDVL